MKKYALLLVCLLSVLLIRGQGIILSEIPNLNKLPTTELLCIFQDSEGYMWYGTEGAGLCRDDGYDIKIFRSDFNTPDVLESNSITCIAEDSLGKIWFGTKRGVYVVDKNEYKITPALTDEIKGWTIRTINATSDGSIWISAGKLLLRYNYAGERLGKYDLEWKGTILEHLYEDPAGNIWMTKEDGLFRYSLPEDEFVAFPWSYKESPTGIIKDAHSPYYWISTWGRGIVRFDPNETNLENMFVMQAVSYQYAGSDKKKVNSIAQDAVKQYLWVTTADNLYAYKITRESTLSPVETSPFLSTDKKILNTIISDRSGNLWVTGYDPCSFAVSFLPNERMNYPIENAKKEIGVLASPMQLYCADDYYWIRQKKKGLYTYNPHTGEISMIKNRYSSSLFFEKSKTDDGVYIIKDGSTIVWIQKVGERFVESDICTIPTESGERIRALFDDGEGHLWIGTKINLFRYDLKDKQLDVICEDAGYINNIIATKNKKIYVTTENKGFWELSEGKRTYIHTTNENYSVLTASPDGKIWVGTLQGNVYCYHPDDHRFVQKTDDCGLNGDVISDIESDDNGNIWIVTNQRLIVYDPFGQTSDIIDCTDPSIRLENFQSLHKGAADGEMHLGGRGGIVVFSNYHKADRDTAYEVDVRLTSTAINNVRHFTTGKGGRVILEPNERNLDLYLSTLDPLHAKKVRYAFRMKRDVGYWNYLPIGQNRIILTELAKGNYEVEIKATNQNGMWSEKLTTIAIQRLPAWYETGWAYLLYVLVGLAVCCFVLHRYIDYQREKHRLKIEEEVAQMKYRFFTNVSHELRTPLTLIITPLETIIAKVTETPLRQQLESIHSNARNLLGLVNQLLDFRKVEMGGEVLSLTQGDIHVFISSICENFRLTAEEKGIRFDYQTEVSDTYIFFDAMKLRKMINNLLSNAFKFTERGGSVSLSLREDICGSRPCMVISVGDTGIGIPAKELPDIFERFHQVSAQEGGMGSGIGLHLVKEYAALHQGEVTVQSEPGRGSTFSIYIPSDLEPAETVHPQPSQDSTQRILIVEDNEAFRTYLKNELSPFYKIDEADNGLDGEQKALDTEPDMIISDVMMSGIDGIELCRRVKNNIKISHIPVILLTADSQVENEKRGYKERADAYIIKPFHWDILLARIQNLMVQKLQRQQAFETEIDINPGRLTISSVDEALINKALEAIGRNLSNTEYSVEEMSRDMCMSRANLYRKIHSITGLSPNELIKNIRLKKAAELLKESQLSIVEVADSVGFNTPNYFTKSFKKLFGVLPTQYKKRQ